MMMKDCLNLSDETTQVQGQEATHWMMMVMMIDDDTPLKVPLVNL